MAQGKRIAVVDNWEAVLTKDDGFREAVRGYVQEVLEAEMDAALGAGKYERSDGRLGPIGPDTTAGR